MFHGNRIIALIGLVLGIAVTQPAFAKPKARGRGSQTRTAQAKAAEVTAEPTPEGAEVPPADASTAQPATPDAASAAPPLAASEPISTEPAPVQEQLPAAASATPVAAPSADETNAATAALRAEVTTLMDDLATARAKAAVLGKTLFKTRIVVRAQNLAGSDLRLNRLLVLLDGAPVFRGDGSALTGDEARQLFEGFAAPGPHVLTFECEQRMRDDDAYGYTLRESYRVKVPRDRETDLLLVLDDDSSDAEDLAEDSEGEYDVRTRLRQTTREVKAR
jgi:hypothetical protein